MSVNQPTSQPPNQPSPFVEDDLLWRQLKTIPAFRAVLRAVESRFYYAVELPGPTLDVGCGDGHFAQMTFNRRLEAGIDPWWGPLQKAERSAAYDLVLQGMGDRLPFPDGHFASAFSNSVLEHIPDVQAVLKETCRVLQVNGRFLITMPSHHFSEWLGGAQFCERLNLPGLAERYRRGFNHISRHVHTDPPEAWAARLAAAGLAVERWQYYFSPQALHALEIGHAQGLPAAVMHALTGHWILAPWESSLAATERWLRPFYEEEAGEQGAYLLIVARKVNDGPIEATLPQARPFTLAELETAVRQHHRAKEDDSQISQISQKEDDPQISQISQIEDLTQRHEEVKSESAENRQSSIVNRQSPIVNRQSSIAFDIIAVPLLLLALSSAFIGQRIVAGETADLWSGPRWFLASFAFLTLFAWRVGAIGGLGGRSWRLPRWERPSFARRRYGYFGGLLLVFAAYRFASGGSWPAWITIGLWLAGCAVGFYALSSASAAAVGRFSQSPDERFGKSFYMAGGAAVLFLIALGIRAVGLTNHPFILNGLEASVGLDVLAVADGLVRNPFATGWLTNPILPYYLMAWPVKLFGPSVFSIRLLAPLMGALTVVAVFWFGRRLWTLEVGLAAAVLLAGSHFHLHYSRLGLANVWDGLFLLLALGFVGLVWQEEVNGRLRHRWLLAGLFIGLNAYLFTASRLLPLTLLILGLLAYFFSRDRLRGQARHIVAALLLAGLVALPQILFYTGNPGIFMERFLAYSPLAGQADWLAREAAAVGGETAVWAQQAQRALLAFNANRDFSPAYRPGAPLLSAIPAIFFVLGVMVALLRPRQTRAALLLVPIGVALLFGAVLLIETPSSHRLVAVAPLVSLVAALGLVEIGGWALALRGEAAGKREWLLPALLILTALVAVSEVWFYNGRYRQSYTFGDRNTEIAHGVADYLNRLEGASWDAYFYGPPNMYIGFPTIPFLAQEFRAGRNLFDVDPVPEAAAAALPTAVEQNLTFIFLPERVGEIGAVQERFGNGRSYSFPGRHVNPLFYVYEVDRDSGLEIRD